MRENSISKEKNSSNLFIVLNINSWQGEKMNKSLIGLTMALLTLTATIIPVLAASVTRNSATVTPRANSNAANGLAHHTQTVKVPDQATTNSKALVKI